MSICAADLKPILKRTEQILIEDVPVLVLCKPRLIPLKSLTLEKLEKMQEEAQKSQEEQSTEAQNQ